MIIDNLTIDKDAFEAGTGWQLKAEGACKGDVCIPLPGEPGSTVDAEQLADLMGLPVVHDEAHGLWSIGPESTGARALTTAQAPDLQLPDLDGNVFHLASLTGQKVIVYAWAPY